MLNDVTERNIELWRSLQPGAAPAAKSAPEADPGTDKPSRKRR
jgi:hypothetical protein